MPNTTPPSPEVIQRAVENACDALHFPHAFATTYEKQDGIRIEFVLDEDDLPRSLSQSIDIARQVKKLLPAGLSRFRLEQRSPP